MRDRAGVSRNQNVMYVMPQDVAAIGQFMGPVLEQLQSTEADEGTATGPRILVVTPDADAAVAIARHIAASPAGTSCDGSPRAIAATSAGRALRLLAARSSPVVAGPADQLLELVRRAALKLDSVRTLVMAWADQLIDSGAMASLEALMNEVPKDAARTVVTTRTTPEVDALVERYARRPRRVEPAADAAVAPLSVRYVMSGAATRTATIRTLLDALDPPSAAIYSRSDDSVREAGDMLRALGYAANDIVRVVREPTSPVALVVLYDLPSSRAELEALAAAAPNQVVALVQPRQLDTLAALAGGRERLVPFSLDASRAAARTSEQRVRDEIREVLGRGLPARELLAIDPLLGDFDAASVAAALLRLLERERERHVPNATPAAQVAPPATAEPDAAAPRRAASGGTARVFVNVGERDGVSARDLVGAIANEADIAGSRIGRVEIRENHSIVELDPADAARAVERLTGIVVRGRRVLARVDRDRGGARERPGRGARVGHARGTSPRRPPTRDRGPSRPRDE